MLEVGFGVKLGSSCEHDGACIMLIVAIRIVGAMKTNTKSGVCNHRQNSASPRPAVYTAYDFSVYASGIAHV